jgi:hypothetical protein
MPLASGARARTGERRRPPSKGVSLRRARTVAVAPDGGQLWRPLAYLQQVEMESHGDHLAATGSCVEGPAVGLIWTLS